MSMVTMACPVCAEMYTVGMVGSQVVGMGHDCPVKIERDRLRAELERYREAIKTALDTMATSNDMQLGPGGVARQAYAHLWHEYFAIPAGIARRSSDESGAA